MQAKNLIKNPASLANVNWSMYFSEVLFANHDEIVPIEGSNLGWGPNIAANVSNICLGLVVEYWPTVGTRGRHNHCSKLCHLCC